MEIKSVTTLENGDRDVVATLQDDETQFLIEFAINHLLAMGATPFMLDEGKVTKETLN